jgi:hypothetical protein
VHVVFFMRHHGYVKNFESTLDALAARGHRVHLAFDQPVEGGTGGPTLRCTLELARRHPTLTHGSAPNVRPDAWEVFARKVRSGLDWMRYLEPELAGATKPRERTRRRAPQFVKRLVDGRGPAIRHALARTMRAIERATPLRAEDVAYLHDHAPDVVLVTPLVDCGSQLGYLRAARRLGIRTGLCVSSWDNLTSKGLIHEVPDVVTMWNDAQRREAVELHDVPDACIVTTGAQSMDHWFTLTPSTTREAFCGDLGLDPTKPLLLYMCSSGFIGEAHEADHVEDWIAWLRGRPEPELREAGVLVRPHPINAEQWRGRDLTRHGNAAVWRLENTEPATEAAKAEFFDSVHHATAVIGLNSTSMIESAAIGRPVLTLLTPEYAESQDGTAHFGLIAGDDGVLVVARSLEEHAVQLTAALANPDYSGERRRRFVEWFVRPRGLDVTATDVLVAELERLAAAPAPVPARPKLHRSALRALLTPVVHSSRVPTAKERARLRKRAQRRLYRSRKRLYRTRKRLELHLLPWRR